MNKIPIKIKNLLKKYTSNEIIEAVESYDKIIK